MGSTVAAIFNLSCSNTHVDYHGNNSKQSWVGHVHRLFPATTVITAIHSTTHYNLSVYKSLCILVFPNTELLTVSNDGLYWRLMRQRWTIGEEKHLVTIRYTEADIFVFTMLLSHFSNRLTSYIAWFQWTDRQTDRQNDCLTPLRACLCRVTIETSWLLNRSCHAILEHNKVCQHIGP